MNLILLVDCCASHQNHLLPKYYTKEDNSLTKDWTGEIAYIHPMFDNDIPRFVKKAAETKILLECFCYQPLLMQSIFMITCIRKIMLR